jgi:hypothetical protein
VLWLQRDGTYIRLEDMETAHIANACRMMIKRCRDARAAADAGNPVGHWSGHESSADRLLKKTLPKIKAFAMELKRRQELRILNDQRLTAAELIEMFPELEDEDA